MKVLLAPVGSRGDVQPQLVLGEELKRRGHSVEFAAPPNFRRDAEARGFSFVPVGEDIQSFLVKNREMTEQNPVLALPRQIALVAAHTERQVRDVLRASEDVDVVVGAGLSFGARIVADKLQVPYVFVCYSVSAMHSALHAPAILPIFGLPRFANRALWFGATQLFDRVLGGTLNRVRAELGLARDRKPWRSIHATEVLLAQDTVLGTLPSDTPGHAAQVAAIVPRSDSRAPLSDLLERFLRGAGAGSRAAQPVVYLGFGSMPTVDRPRIVRMATELFEQHGARVILFSSHGEEAGVELAPGVISVEEADHSLLFPQVDLIVHHGGAGTTAAALRSGVPQLIVPHIVDQFFHGRRVAELGLGPKPVPKTKLTAAAIAQALQDRFKYWSKAQTVRASLGLEGGALEAANHVEGLVRRLD